MTVGGRAIYDRLEHPATAAVAGIGGVTVSGRITFSYSPGGAVAPTDAGVYGVAASFVSDDPDYRDTSATGSLVIDWPVVAALTYPPNGATGVRVPVPFQWTAVHAVQRYYLYVGSTPGAKDLVNTGEITATSYLAGSLPRGQTLYARLWTKVGNVWRFADSQFVVPAPTVARVESRTMAFDGAAHDVSVTATDLGGSAIPGSFRLTYSTADGLPPVSAGTYSATAIFTSADARFEDARATGSIVIEPAAPRLAVSTDRVVFDGAAHGGSASATGVDGGRVQGSFTFAYSGSSDAPSAAGEYLVTVGFASGDPNYIDAAATGSITITPAAPAISLTAGPFVFDGTGHAAQAVVADRQGRAIAGVVTVTYQPGGASPPVNSGTYTATARFASADANYLSGDASATIAVNPAIPRVMVATLTYPPDGATNVDLSVPLQWTTVDRPDAYYLYLGSSRGAKDLANTGEIAATSFRASNLLRGETVYARLWTKVQGTWRYSDSTFTAARLIATLTNPSPGATGVDLSRPLQWTPVPGAQVYYVYVGSTPGAKDLLNTGEIVSTSYLAARLPAGQVLYVRLWTKVGSVWRYQDSNFTAAPLDASP